MGCAACACADWARTANHGQRWADPRMRPPNATAHSGPLSLSLSNQHLATRTHMQGDDFSWRNSRCAWAHTRPCASITVPVNDSLTRFCMMATHGVDQFGKGNSCQRDHALRAGGRFGPGLRQGTRRARWRHEIRSQASRFAQSLGCRRHPAPDRGRGCGLACCWLRWSCRAPIRLRACGQRARHPMRFNAPLLAARTQMPAPQPGPRTA